MVFRDNICVLTSQKYMRIYHQGERRSFSENLKCVNNDDFPINSLAPGGMQLWSQTSNFKGILSIDSLSISSEVALK